ncbi:MAG: hypothetical protein AMJ45_06080 [Syntrophobacter sp. DG_60]|nr:MAG: hypothetical protein AMJ45_06080 [Syntrophobacter sp. DG_60]
MKGYIVANFAEMGRSNLRPLFDRLFDRGEIDLETVTPDDIEYFSTQSPRIPTFIAGIEKFYSKEAINKRKERWKREEELEFLDFLLENYHRIDRNEPCPCGSGKKFRKCHLPILEARKREIEAIEAKEERSEQLFENRLAISMEREAEMKIRQILARYHKTHLFKEIKENVIRAMKAPNEEFLEKGVWYYLQPVLDKLEFPSEREVKEFLEHLRNYWNAISLLYKGFGDYGH